MRIYLAGPIAGYERRNEPHFRAVEQVLAAAGHDVIVPLDVLPWQHEGSCPRGYTTGEGHSSACWLRGDLPALLTADAVYMLDGWEWSRGASLEHRVAVECGLTVFYETRTEDVPALTGWDV